MKGRQFAMNRETLHSLVDRLPDQEIGAAARFLQYLSSHRAYRAALSAPIDDEPVTEADAKAFEQAKNDLRAARVVSHDDVRREFGLEGSLHGPSRLVPNYGRSTGSLLLEFYKR